MLIENVEKVLEEGGYEHCRYSGCFDIAARRKDIFLLKILENIDSFQREKSDSLKALSRTINATAAVISDHTNREHLRDGIIYERFDLPVVNVRTLGMVLSGEFPERYRTRGGTFAEIDSCALKSARRAKEMTQTQLARRAGITKKNIYEHERSNKGMRLYHAHMLEQILETDLISPTKMDHSYDVRIEPQRKFEQEVMKEFEFMGFSTDFVLHSPFNMVARDKKALIISEAEEDIRNIERKIPYVKKFSSLLRAPAIAITKEKADLDIPAVQQEDLRTLKKRDIKRLVE